MADIHITEQSEPTTPQSGKTKIYVDEVDSHFKTKDSTGTVIDLTQVGSAPQTVVYVQDAGSLAGVLDSTKEYIIDGIIDMGTQSIEVPAGGLNIRGYNSVVSCLTSSASNYTMFTSPVGDSGTLSLIDVGITTNGSNSKVFDITDATGFNAFAFNSVSFNDCSSLGEINHYRQGLEFNTIRSGGSPDLTLSGVWAGGYAINTSIVLNLDASFTGSLYQAGAGFLMNSRFTTNQNITLPVSASFLDFSDVNFTSSSLLQLKGCIVTRNGVSDSSDPNLTPNIGASNLVCKWKGNNGLPNTFEGGELDVTTEVETVISAVDTFTDLLGTYTATDLQHFDSPSNGQLRHLGTDPTEYKLQGQLIIDGTANDEVAIKTVIYRDATTSFEDGKTVVRVISALQGGRNVAHIVLHNNIILSENDYVKLQVENRTGSDNVTAELNSFFVVEAR